MSAAGQVKQHWSHTERKPPPIWLWLLLGALPVIAVVAFATLQPIKVRPRMALAPAFALTDTAGQRVTNEDMRGKLVLYQFTHTGCGERCAPLDAVMRDFQDSLPLINTSNLPVALATISIDPTRDTPARLQEHAATVGANPDVWRFLTGEPAQLKNVVGGGFNVYYNEEADGSYKFDPTLVLVDGAGIVRAEYGLDTASVETVTRDFQLIVDEILRSDGPGRLVYEAAHLFMCYPKS
ncbi:MAG: SCO family protein [Caldilineaceae bacterium]|nr:SCO family protein [Caldilineaceae bacterium]